MRSRSRNAPLSRLDAAVDAERQAVAGGVDRIQQLVQPIRAHSARRTARARRSPPSARLPVAAGRRAARRSCHARCRQAAAARTAGVPDCAAARCQRCARFLVDHRTDVGGGVQRVADHATSRRPRAACAARGRRYHPAGTATAAPSSAGRREPNALVSTSVTTCSGSAELSTIIALMPPVSAMSGTIGPGRAASDRAIVCAVSVPPGERDARYARIVHQRLRRPSRRPAAAPARPRHAGFAQQLRRRARRSAASARPAWRPPHCLRRALRRPGQ